MNVTHEELVNALQTYFGFDMFKGNQEAIIRNVMDGKDTFVLMPTGGGKSLCYQLPSLIMDGVAIVISPLIALMKNQVDAMRNYSEEEGVAHFINSSLSRSEINAVRDDVVAAVRDSGTEIGYLEGGKQHLTLSDGNGDDGQSVP